MYLPAASPLCKEIFLGILFCIISVKRSKIYWFSCKNVIIWSAGRRLAFEKLLKTVTKQKQASNSQCNCFESWNISQKPVIRTNPCDLSSNTFTRAFTFLVQFSILKVTFMLYICLRWEIYTCCPVELWTHIVKKVEEIKFIQTFTDSEWDHISF